MDEEKKPAPKAKRAPTFKLVVREAFGPYRRGDEITEQPDMDAVLESHPGHVVRVSL